MTVDVPKESEKNFALSAILHYGGFVELAHSTKHWLKTQI
jgi:hypothetical protein